MKTKISFFLLLLTGCLLPFACQNDLDKTGTLDDSISIESAQNWFTKEISPSGARVATDGLLNIKSINWAKADFYTFKFGKAVVVPLVYDKALTPVIGGNGAPTYRLTVNQLNSLVIFKDSNGKFHELLYHVYPENEYLIRSQGRKLKVPFSGRVIITDWNDKKIAGYEYEKGITTGRLVLDPSQQGARAKGCYSTEWYSCVSTDGGNSWGCRYTHTTTNCDYFCTACGHNPDITLDYDGPAYYEGGGGGSYEVFTTSDITVDPNLNNCFKNVINTVTTDRYNAYLLKRARDIFGNNGGAVNLKFASGPADGSLGGFSDSEKTIFLDPSKLDNQSNEWVATVIFHELCHAMINEYNHTTSFLAPPTYDQHVEIFAKMVSDMAVALKQVFPNLTDIEATSLSLQGMDDYIRDSQNNIRPEVDQAARQKFGIGLADAAANAAPYATGAKGTKCNQ